MQTLEELNSTELVQIIETTVQTTIKSLVEQGLLVSANSTASQNANADRSANSQTANANANCKRGMTAYQKTEQLLFNYLGFKRVIREKQVQIEDIQTYGVLERGAAVRQYGGNTGGKPRGIVLDEERKEQAIREIEKQMQPMVQAVELVDRGMAELQAEPYYKALEMRYFEDRTQEDIAVFFHCTRPNITYHMRRLINKLAMRIFPDQVAQEMLE